MTLKGFLALIGAILLNIVLESVLVPTINLFGLRPDTIIPIVVAMALVSGSVNGALYGLVTGLILSIYFGDYLGMFAIAYVVWGLFIGFFFDKFYAHNAVFVAIAGFLGYLFKELVMMIQFFFLRESFTVGVAFWRYMVPSAIITGLLCIPVYYIYRKNRRFEMRRARWGKDADKAHQRFLR